MESFRRVNPHKEALTRSNSPRFVADIDKDIISAIESTEGQPVTNSGNFLDGS
jgi:hypothetical protein